MIPKRVFQVLGLLALTGCVALSFAHWAYGGWPYPLIDSASGTRVLGVLVALMVGLLLGLMFVIPLRLASDMKPVHEEWASLSFEQIRSERAKLEAMRRGTPAERRRFHLGMAGASFACLLVGAPITYASYEAGTTMFALPIALVVYGVFGPPVHLALAFLLGRARR